MHAKRKSRAGMEKRFHLAFISLAVLALVLTGFSGQELAQNLEDRGFDYLQRTRYRIQGGPVFDKEQLAMIAVDDKSIDPKYSAFSDPWGRGGWQSREFYTAQLQVLAAPEMAPTVVAYDLLFLAVEGSRSSAVREKFAEMAALRGQDVDTEKLYQLEIDGNNAFAAELNRLGWMRDLGEEVPEMVLACYFPTSRNAEARLETEEASRWHKDIAQYVEPNFLPDGLVEEGGQMVVHPVVSLPADALLAASVRLGPINVEPDRGGIVRRVPLIYACRMPGSGRENYIPGFAFSALLAHLDIQVKDLKPPGEGYPSLKVIPGRSITLATGNWSRTIPVDDQCRLLLNTRCRYLDVDPKSFADVTDYGMELFPDFATRSEDPEVRSRRQDRARDVVMRLRGKVVVVAQALTGGGDIGDFPMENTIPNGMAHLYVLDNILRDDMLRDIRDSGMAWEYALYLALTLVCAGLYAWLPVDRASFLTIGLILAYPLFVYFCFTAGYLLPLIVPMLLLLLLFAANVFYYYTTESRDRKLVRGMFSTMVSPEVLEMLEENPEQLSLGGQKTEATMFFSDLAGFTSISEKLSPEELTGLLNRYLTPMTDIILSHKGHLDKYSGDGIMAVWGVLPPGSDHAVPACRAALEQQEKVSLLAREIREELGIGIHVRMGLNSGTVVAGNMGSDQKMQFTVMGDAVNLAARLEPVNKDYSTRIIVGPHTRALAAGGGFTFRTLDKMVVKGKTEPVLIHELVDPKLLEKSGMAWIEAYEEGLHHLWARNWDDAEEAFSLCIRIRADDGAAAAMLKRVSYYRAHQPDQDWQGVFVRLAKD